MTIIDPNAEPQLSDYAPPLGPVTAAQERERIVELITARRDFFAKRQAEIEDDDDEYDALQETIDLFDSLLKDINA